MRSNGTIVLENDAAQDTVVMCDVFVLQEDKTAVLVGTITDDVRLYEVPKLTVVALRVTETARARILGVSSCFQLSPAAQRVLLKVEYCRTSAS